MCEFTANAIQTVQPGETVVFTDTVIPCTQGIVRHRDDTGAFVLSGNVTRKPCGCMPSSAHYGVSFGANIALPADETAPAEISVVFAIDGVAIPSTAMRVTPAVADRYWNVARSTNVAVWRGCCQTLSITNTSAVAINVQNANITFDRTDLNY